VPTVNASFAKRVSGELASVGLQVYVFSCAFERLIYLVGVCLSGGAKRRHLYKDKHTSHKQGVDIYSDLMYINNTRVYGLLSLKYNKSDGRLYVFCRLFHEIKQKVGGDSVKMLDIKVK